MEHWLNEFSHYVALSIEAVAILIIAIGSAEAFINVFRVMLVSRSATTTREVWLRYARWLVVGDMVSSAKTLTGTSELTAWLATASSEAPCRKTFEL